MRNRREYQKRYYVRHRAKAGKYYKKYYKAHKAKLLLQSGKYYRKVSKKTPKIWRKYRKVRLAKRKAWMDELKNKPCIDCKKSFPPICMDFDHVQGKKKFTISRGINRRQSEILKEIAKCELVCACCHRKRTEARYT